MEITRRSYWVYGLLAAVLVLMVGWQTEEHFRFCSAAKIDLRNRSKDIANTVNACVRGMRFPRGEVSHERVVAWLNELVNGRTNELLKSSELISVALLNAGGQLLSDAGRTNDYLQRDVFQFQEGERWGQRSVTFVIPVDLGASVLPPRSELTNSFRDADQPPPPPPSEGPPPESPSPPKVAESLRAHEAAKAATNEPARGPEEGRWREGEFRRRRPPRFFGMSETDYKSMMEKRALHYLVITMSTIPFQAASSRDFWLRTIILGLAAVSALGSGLAWRNLAKSSDLQIRLVRASELNTHLKEMNLAAAGLAHETRNPLNIIRGLAQMVSKETSATAEMRQKSREIVEEADKVAAQLNEFINYSRPREVRRAVLPLSAVVNDVARTLGYDLEEKKIRFEVTGDILSIEADEQLLRQALFNLLLNAIQAVDGNGEIQVIAQRRNASEGCLEVRDNGPGVRPECRTEIFKPYFTMQAKGTGLGLAVVQQIVLAHGWEIQCLPNTPKGAVFRISHLRVAA